MHFATPSEPTRAEVGVEEDAELAGVEAEADWPSTVTETVIDPDEPPVELTDTDADATACEPSVTLAKAPSPISIVTDTSELTLSLSSGHSIPSEAETEVAAAAAEVIITVTEASAESEPETDSDSSGQSSSSEMVEDPSGIEVTCGSTLATPAEDSSGQSSMISEADVAAATAEVVGAEVMSASLVTTSEDADSGRVSERASEVICGEVIAGVISEALVRGKRVTFSVSTKEVGGAFPMTIRKLSYQKSPEHRGKMDANRYSPCIGIMSDNKMSDNWRILLAE